MHRGKALQPEQDCEYCGQPLPALRHPKMLWCNSTCRQRDYYQRNHEVDGLKCLDCGKIFTRVGSHVVQVHGYASVTEYRVEHGLMAKETRLQDYADEMSQKASTQENLELGKPTRFKKGGPHGDHVKIFWKIRKQKMGYKKLNMPLGNKTIDNRQ